MEVGQFSGKLGYKRAKTKIFRLRYWRSHYESSSSFSWFDVVGAKRYVPLGMKWRDIMVITQFKATTVGINGKPVCNFLLVNNTDLRPISHRFAAYGQISAVERECVSLTHSTMNP